MDNEKFIEFLETVKTDKGAHLSMKAIKARAKWVARVEREFNVSMDSVVTDKEKTLDLVETVMKCESISANQRYNFPNGIRYYFEFRNGTKLGTLRENNRR